jgi:hypothetical protein
MPGCDPGFDHVQTSQIGVRLHYTKNSQGFVNGR